MCEKLIFILLISVCYSNEHHPLVKTPLGLVRGYIKTSHGGRKYAAFEGIPFAKPPTGNRRFEPPEPREPWTGTWEALHLSECPQVFFQPNITRGDEDCLYINVYVPREKPNPSENLDVIVHIHGGAFMLGSGHMISKPDFLMDRDIIFVHFNYRLGILGFLTTEDDTVSGNMGMKDQVLALKWVQNNIASFGGNPNSVTLTGLSAGASSVHLHYFSDLSKGLFHRGFSQSGTALLHWSLQEKGLKKAKILSEAVGCPSNPNRVLVDCLKQRPLGHILEKTSLFHGYKFLPFAPFAPVVEKGSNGFLKSHPYQSLLQGNVLDVPWITSVTSHEGLFPLFYLTPEDLDQIDKNWNSLAPSLLDFNFTISESLKNRTSEKIKDFYLGENQKITQEDFEGLVRMFSDRQFLADADSAAKLQAKVATSPVYFYYFGYPGDENPGNRVSHGADAKYFFGTIFDQRPLTKNELKMKDVMLDMLVAFAKTGTPVVKGVEWKPTKYDKLTFLNISHFEPEGMNLQIVEGLGQKKFWVSLGLSENENLFIPKDEL